MGFKKRPKKDMAPYDEFIEAVADAVSVLEDYADPENWTKLQHTTDPWSRVFKRQGPGHAHAKEALEKLTAARIKFKATLP